MLVSIPYKRVTNDTVHTGAVPALGVSIPYKRVTNSTKRICRRSRKKVSIPYKRVTNDDISGVIIDGQFCFNPL